MRALKMVRIIAVLFLAASMYFWYESQSNGHALTDLAAQDLICGDVIAPCQVGNRSYNILVPQGEGPFPAVIFFHGSGGSGASVIRDAALVAPLLQKGYALIAPSALDVTYSGGRRLSGWIWEGQRDGRDDYRFVQDVINDATSKFPIQEEDLIVAGHSNGATFVWYLACEGLDTRLRNFATIGGTPVRDRLLSCADVRPSFNLYHTHGTADSVVPVDGTQRTATWHGWLGAIEAVEMMAAASGCSEKEEIATSETTETTRWYGCQSGAEFRVDLNDGGHEIPTNWVETLFAWSQDLP